MRTRFTLLCALLIALATAGCRSLQLEAGFQQPAALTATAQVRPQPTPPAAVDAAESALRAQLRVQPDELKLVTWEPTTWPDACLGVPATGTSCKAASTPGYRLTAELRGQGPYEFHTNQDGSLVLLASGPQARIKDIALYWQGPGVQGLCQRLDLAADGAALLGLCGAPQLPLTLAGDAGRLGQLTYLLDRFAAFKAQSPSDVIVLNDGHGTEMASPAWQRAIAEWARLSAQELQAGRSGASRGTLLQFQQQGKEGDLCRSLEVESYGLAYATTGSCKGDNAQQLAQGWLTTAELEQLYAWRDAYASVERPLPARLVLSGSGQAQPSAADVTAMVEWARNLYARLTGGPAPLTTNLEEATLLVAGAPQAAVLKVTDTALIRTLAQLITAAPVAPEPSREGAGLYYLQFYKGDRVLAHVWVLRSYASGDVLAIRMDGEDAWRSVSPELGEQLAALLRQAPRPVWPSGGT